MVEKTTARGSNDDVAGTVNSVRERIRNAKRVDDKACYSQRADRTRRWDAPAKHAFRFAMTETYYARIVVHYEGWKTRSCRVSQIFCINMHERKIKKAKRIKYNAKSINRISTK